MHFCKCMYVCICAEGGVLLEVGGLSQDLAVFLTQTEIGSSLIRAQHTGNTLDLTMWPIW